MGESLDLTLKENVINRFEEKDRGKLDNDPNSGNLKCFRSFFALDVLILKYYVLLLTIHIAPRIIPLFHDFREAFLAVPYSYIII